MNRNPIEHQIMARQGTARLGVAGLGEAGQGVCSTEGALHPNRSRTRTMSDARPHPIDFDALNYGDSISTDELEEILGIDRDHRTFSLESTKLAGLIEGQLVDRGLPATVCIVKQELRVLTPAEASTHNDRAHNKHIRGMGRTHVRMMRVESHLLTPEQQREHDRRLRLQSMTIQGMRDGRKRAISDNRTGQVEPPE